MSRQLVILLFAVNSVLVLTVLAILLSVLKHGKNIADLAEETESLARHAEQFVGADADFDGSDSSPELGIQTRS